APAAARKGRVSRSERPARVRGEHLLSPKKSSGPPRRPPSPRASASPHRSSRRALPRAFPTRRPSLPTARSRASSRRSRSSASRPRSRSRRRSTAGGYTIGELAKLPEGEVASRLGEAGRALHATARGIDPRPLEPRVPPPCFTEGMELEWPLASLEPFLFVGHAALERLVRRLEAQALACTRLDVALKLDPDGHDARSIALPAPTRDVKTLITLVRLELEARPPGAAVAGFSFTAHPDAPRRAQLSLFGPAALSPDRLATTIARLAALLGADRVGSPRSIDGHRPERFTTSGYAPPPPPTAPLPPPH